MAPSNDPRVLSRRMPGFPTRVKKQLPLLVFVLFACAWIVILLQQSPGWGLMDDAQNLEIARHICSAQHPFGEFWRTTTWDMNHIGTFRPGYYLWIVTAYTVFARQPLALYILIALFNLIVLVGWGLLAARVFHPPARYRALVVFGYPLSFFFFTPLCNIFMYVSLQEKFILLFGLLSTLALAAYFRNGRVTPFLLALAAFLAGLATKSTMVYLGLGYMLFAITDLLLLGTARRRSAAVLIVYATTVTGFYLFISSHLGVYTGRYGQRLRPAILLRQLLSAPRIIQLLCLLAAFVFVWLVVRIRSKRYNGAAFALIVPLALLSYIATILAWGFPNYMLSPLAPWALLLLFPLLQTSLDHRPEMCRWLALTVFIALVLLVAFVIHPRIEQMADSRRLLAGVRFLNAPERIFFLPPPYMETGEAIARFTGVRAKYLATGTLTRRQLRSDSESFLIFGRDFPPLRLDGVRPGAEVYGNSTWKIFRLEPAPGQKRKFRPSFAVGLFDRFSRLLR